MALIISVPWDLIAANSKVWSFPRGHNYGIYIGSLPIEEYLFIISDTLIITTIVLLLRSSKRLGK